MGLHKLTLARQSCLTFFLPRKHTQGALISHFFCKFKIKNTNRQETLFKKTINYKKKYQIDYLFRKLLSTIYKKTYQNHHIDTKDTPHSSANSIHDALPDSRKEATKLQQTADSKAAATLSSPARPPQPGCETSRNIAVRLESASTSARSRTRFGPKQRVLRPEAQNVRLALRGQEGRKELARRPCKTDRTLPAEAVKKRWRDTRAHPRDALANGF